LRHEQVFCLMLRVTSEGSPYGRFQRAIQVRSVLAAETAARELGRLNLLDAIDLCLLMATEAPERYDRAAKRWFVRLVSERETLTLDQAALALACLRGLASGDRERLADVLRGLAGGRQGSSRHWR
jgi:hypothetical protein